MIDYLNPPEYCKEAIATDVGWVNPRNGELLVAVKGLRERIEEVKRAEESKLAKNVMESLTQQIVNSTIEVNSSPRNLTLSLDENVTISEQFPMAAADTPAEPEPEKKQRKKRAAKE